MRWSFSEDAEKAMASSCTTPTRRKFFGFSSPEMPGVEEALGRRDPQQPSLRFATRSNPGRSFYFQNSCFKAKLWNEQISC